MGDRADVRRLRRATRAAAGRTRSQIARTFARTFSHQPAPSSRSRSTTAKTSSNGSSSSAGSFPSTTTLAEPPSRPSPAPPYDGRSSTGSGPGSAGLAGNSRTAGSTSGSGSSSSPSIPTAIKWNRLSPEGAWRMTYLALPISCGLSPLEVADQVGETTRWVAKQLLRSIATSLRE